jgi:hypothetical protein
MGVFFWNSGMTNITGLSTATNFSVWMVLAMANQPTNWSQILGALTGDTNRIQTTNTAEMAGFWGTATTLTNLLGFCGNEGQSGGFSWANFYYPPLWNDISDSQGSVYLNGASSGGSIGVPKQTMSWSALANATNSATEPFQGFLKYLLISTNHAITATEASNLWVWEMTNGVTNVSGGCVGWWKINDASNSTTIADSSGGGRTGNCVNSPVWTNGLNSVVSQALSFNGTTETVNIPITTNFFTNSFFTVSAWVKHVGTGGGTPTSWIAGYANITDFILGEHGTTSSAGQGFQIIDEGDIRIEVNSVSGADESEGYAIYFPTDYTYWHHVVGASDGTNSYQWVDGIQYQSIAGLLDASNAGNAVNAGNWWTGLTNIQIGAPCVTNTVLSSCIITDVRIWNRILNDSEVDILYRAPTVDNIVGAYNY